MRLSLGLPLGGRILATAAGLFMSSIEAFLLYVLGFEGLGHFFSDGVGIGKVALFVLSLLFTGAALYVVGGLAWGCLRLGRSATWLSGSRVVERRIVMRRKVDLRTARVQLVEDTKSRPPKLVLTATGATGRTVEVPVKEASDALPRRELAAIADAITVGRPAGPERDAAVAVADRLRLLADEPESVSRN